MAISAAAQTCTSHSPTSQTCTLCGLEADRYEITGMKTLKNNQQHAYRLCPECCKKLPPLSLYNPATTKLRREFWNKVWKKLKSAVNSSTKAK